MGATDRRRAARPAPLRDASPRWCRAGIASAVVLPEEAFLERRFGEAYQRYRARVPRWL